MNCFMVKGVSFSLSATQVLMMTQPIRLGDSDSVCHRDDCQYYENAKIK